MGVNLTYIGDSKEKAKISNKWKEADGGGPEITAETLGCKNLPFISKKLKNH